MDVAKTHTHSDEEAFEMAKLEQERDALAREHYVLRKKNARANTLIEKFQGNFQVIHDKQSKAASEIYSFAEKLRGEHLESKEKMSNQIRYVLNIAFDVTSTLPQTFQRYNRQTGTAAKGEFRDVKGA